MLTMVERPISTPRARYNEGRPLTVFKQVEDRLGFRSRSSESLLQFSLWVGQASRPASSRGVPAPRTFPGDWKVARTGRHECLPYELGPHDEDCWRPYG